MFRDAFTTLHGLAVIVVLAVMVLLLGGFAGSGDGANRSRPNPALEAAMQDRARAAFILETYEPVESLASRQRYAEALLRLQELDRQFPGEPHTRVLRAGILVRQGAVNEGIAQYAAAVRLNGDYVDRNSRLNRREEIAQLVESTLPEIRASLRRSPNPSLEKTLKETYYLQSRLAGGCE